LDQRVVEGLESFDIGTHGLRAEGEIDYAVTDPHGVLTPLHIHGDFLDASAQLSYPFLRTQALSIYGSARFDYVNQKNDIGILQGIVPGEPVLFEDKLRLLTFSGDLRARPEALPHVEADASLQLVQGVGGLGGSHKGDFALSRLEADPLATVLRADALLRWTASPRWTFDLSGGPWIELRGSAQTANHPLPAFEEFQIGNYTIGRGYSPGAASGDRAIGGTIEAGWRAPLGSKSGGPLQWVEPYGFVDAAHLTNLDTAGYSTSVVSVGAGLRAMLPFELMADIAYAQPLDRPFPGAAKPGGRLLLRVSRVFSFH
jgi:hemolysin activation/secretion protein